MFEWITENIIKSHFIIIDVNYYNVLHHIMLYYSVYYITMYYIKWSYQVVVNVFANRPKFLSSED